MHEPHAVNSNWQDPIHGSLILRGLVPSIPRTPMSPFQRHVIFVACTASALVTLGRAPGAINLRLRDIETAISIEAKVGRDKKVVVRPNGGANL
jgi:hypothetical protein